MLGNKPPADFSVWRPNVSSKHFIDAWQYGLPWKRPFLSNDDGAFRRRLLAILPLVKAAPKPQGQAAPTMTTAIQLQQGPTNPPMPADPGYGLSPVTAVPFQPSLMVYSPPPKQVGAPPPVIVGVQEPPMYDPSPGRQLPQFSLVRCLA